MHAQTHTCLLEEEKKKRKKCHRQGNSILEMCCKAPWERKKIRGDMTSVVTVMLRRRLGPAGDVLTAAAAAAAKGAISFFLYVF